MTQSPGMSELRGLAETALEVLVVVHAKDDAGSALELERDVKAGFSTLLDDLAAAHARADRMEGALRSMVAAFDASLKDSGAMARAIPLARSALTIKSEKAPSSLKGSDVGEVGE